MFYEKYKIIKKQTPFRIYCKNYDNKNDLAIALFTYIDTYNIFTIAIIARKYIKFYRNFSLSVSLFFDIIII